MTTNASHQESCGVCHQAPCACVKPTDGAAGVTEQSGPIEFERDGTKFTLWLAIRVPSQWSADGNMSSTGQHFATAADLRTANYYPDAPELDATDGASPAWWRGHDNGSKGVEVIRFKLDEAEAARDGARRELTEEKRAHQIECEALRMTLTQVTDKLRESKAELARYQAPSRDADRPDLEALAGARKRLSYGSSVNADAQVVFAALDYYQAELAREYAARGEAIRSGAPAEHALSPQVAAAQELLLTLVSKSAGDWELAARSLAADVIRAEEHGRLANRDRHLVTAARRISETGQAVSIPAKSQHTCVVTATTFDGRPPPPCPACLADPEKFGIIGHTPIVPLPINPMATEGNFTITLSEYHVVNLRELIKCCGFDGTRGASSRAAFAYNTGDWLGELWWKLEKFGPCALKPNKTLEQVATDAKLEPPSDTTPSDIRCRVTGKMRCQCVGCWPNWPNPEAEKKLNVERLRVALQALSPDDLEAVVPGVAYRKLDAAVEHLRSEYAKVERLWKEATVEREALSATATRLRYELWQVTTALGTGTTGEQPADCAMRLRSSADTLLAVAIAANNFADTKRSYDAARFGAGGIMRMGDVARAEKRLIDEVDKLFSNPQHAVGDASSPVVQSTDKQDRYCAFDGCHEEATDGDAVCREHRTLTAEEASKAETPTSSVGGGVEGERQTIGELIDEELEARGGMTPALAEGLAATFGTSPDLWLNFALANELAAASPPCWCHKCNPDQAVFDRRMILCPTCGNKRCPKASDHDLGCSGSNEPGQPGSVHISPKDSRAASVNATEDAHPSDVAPVVENTGHLSAEPPCDQCGFAGPCERHQAEADAYEADNRTTAEEALNVLDAADDAARAKQEVAMSATEDDWQHVDPGPFSGPEYSVDVAPCKHCGKPESNGIHHADGPLIQSSAHVYEGDSAQPETIEVNGHVFVGDIGNCDKCGEQFGARYTRDCPVAAQEVAAESVIRSAEAALTAAIDSGLAAKRAEFKAFAESVAVPEVSVLAGDVGAVSTWTRCPGSITRHGKHANYIDTCNLRGGHEGEHQICGHPCPLLGDYCPECGVNGSEPPTDEPQPDPAANAANYITRTELVATLRKMAGPVGSSSARLADRLADELERAK